MREVASVPAHAPSMALPPCVIRIRDKAKAESDNDQALLVVKRLYPNCLSNWLFSSEIQGLVAPYPGKQSPGAPMMYPIITFRHDCETIFLIQPVHFKFQPKLTPNASRLTMSSLLFGNGTDIVHWRSSPNTRSTLDILSTCIITLLLCVWTAVHLNISQPASVWRPRLRKFGWLVLALLAPEIVVYTAWYVCFIKGFDGCVSLI